MPREFWDLADLAPVEELEAWYERAMGHLIYYQTKLILHIPYMLKSAHMSDYGYSRDLCFESGRSLLRVFHKLRAEANDHAYRSKAIDFVAFMATVALMLRLLGYGQQNYSDPKQQDDDWMLIQTTMAIFKRVSEKPFSKVASQSYRALLQLTRFRDNGPDINQRAETKIAIPFFGTISLQRAQRTSSIQTPGENMDTHLAHEYTRPWYPSIEPQTSFDGFHMQQSAYEHPSYVLESASGYTASAPTWQTVRNFDMDQDWSWLANNVPPANMLFK